MKPRSQLFTDLYEKLRGLARHRLAHENRPGDATSLVHEAYLKLRIWAESFQNERHFLATASRAMRQVLVDRARSRAARKRAMRVEPISVSMLEPAEASPHIIDVLLLDELLERLAQFDARAAQITEMRVFLGLSEEEIAVDLGVSSRTVKRDWAVAAAWLKAEMAAHSDRQTPPSTNTQNPALRA
jgi:RNA polymerase sigma factor (TIGR02999 family)